jgi:polygalacturonase
MTPHPILFLLSWAKTEANQLTYAHTGRSVGRSIAMKAEGGVLLKMWSRGRIGVVGVVALGISAVVTSVGFGSAPGSNSFSSSSFSNDACSASGATATRLFVPSGAVPNTTNDNRGPIQRAINAAASAGGGIVALPAGTFLIDGHLILKNNVELTGVGPTTVLTAGPKFLDSTGPDGGYPIVTTAGASNVTIANLTADQSGDVLNGNTDPNGRLEAYLVDVRNSHNVVVDGVYTRNPFTYSIGVVGSNHFCVVHCNTRVATSGRYNQLDGIHVLDSNTGQVIDNYVNQRVGTDGDDGLVAHTIGAPVYDVLYANNTVLGGSNGDGMQLAVGNYPIYNVTIRNNDFYDSPFGIRTGYYDSGTNGAVHNITISGNYIHDLRPGRAFPDGGNAINIGGFGAIAPVTYIKVTNNRTCKAGIITVVSGTGNTVTQNRSC